MWVANPNCHWCQEPTRYGDGYRNERMGIADDAATIDHLYPRGHPKRGQPGGYSIVLACHSCNQFRNEIDYLMWHLHRTKI